MVAAAPPLCEFGWKAPDFRLTGIDGKSYDLARAKGAKGLLIMFICNHCPYVRSIIARIERDAAELRSHDIGTIAIMSNDVVRYPADSFENMKVFAADNKLTFPYVIDETQEVARAYGAICTPDFFGFNGALELQYRGRLDESRTTLVPNARRELFEAMRQVAETGRGPGEQQASMGCSIKWKAA